MTESDVAPEAEGVHTQGSMQNSSLDPPRTFQERLAQSGNARTTDRARLDSSIRGRIDSRSVLIPSANFTEAAQQRNIEVGILANSESLAHRLTAFFDKGLSEGVFHLALDSGPACAEMVASTNS